MACRSRAQSEHCICGSKRERRGTPFTNAYQIHTICNDRGSDPPHNNGSRQLRLTLSLSFAFRSVVSRFVAPFSLAVASCLCSTAAHADQLEQHNDLVSKYINEQHANPLAADCAAHAVFIIGTSPTYDHVEFPDDTLTDARASIEPWNGAFGTDKQRIKVDTMVKIQGQGFRKNGGSDPDPLEFRCGYADNKLLAFDSNEPNTGGSGGKKHGKGGSTKGKHGAAKSSGHSTSHGKKKH